jgi:hypothetical protein
MRELLALPLLLPLLAALLVGVFNLRTPARLRLLVWVSPSLPLGSWVLLAAGAGAGLSAAATLLAAQAPRRSREPDHIFEVEPRVPSRAAKADIWPERSPHEPAPTVSVPFRVVQRSPVAEPASAGDWSEPAAEDW